MVGVLFVTYPDNNYVLIVLLINKSYKIKDKHQIVNRKLKKKKRFIRINRD